MQFLNIPLDLVKVTMMMHIPKSSLFILVCVKSIGSTMSLHFRLCFPSLVTAPIFRSSLSMLVAITELGAFVHTV